MRIRVLALGSLSVLVGLLMAGCGQRPISDGSQRHVQVRLGQDRSAVRRYADVLALAAARSHSFRRPAMFGGYQLCRKGQDLVNYNEVITLRGASPATMTAMSREVSGMLHSEGWRLVSVDFAKVHLALADTNHPLYDMSRPGAKGAANILPYGKDRAGAIIFIHSSCLHARSFATEFGKSGRP
jgi:hypothetical protein